MWITTNGLGQRVVWYSEEEYQTIGKLNEANKGLLTATAKQNYRLLQEYDRLKTCLAEIKEIISSTLDCGEWIGQGDNKMEKILNKISEVSNEIEN